MSSVASADDDGESFISIGLDFGTTNSGLAWALSTDANDVVTISQWDSKIRRNHDEDKVPSAICYSKEGTITSWGFDMKPDDHQVSWFKLMLADATKTTVAKHKCYPGLVLTLETLGKEPVDVTADYLRKIWEHAIQVLHSKIGESLLESLKIKVVLTVPAIWDHMGQDLTRQAAQRAGITTGENTTLQLVSEPEAAAIAVLKDNRSLKTGDAFVVCDAGGGTVDLVGYMIEKSKPRKLTMCTQATGGLHGATFLDDAFVELIISLIGDRAYRKLSPRSQSKMMEDWEGIKRNFKHNQLESDDWIVDLNGYNGRKASKSKTPRNLTVMEAGFVKLKSDQITSIFEKVCPHIVKLVKDQVKEIRKFASLEPKAIMLVGGFGENRYLYEALKIEFPQLEVLQPVKAWSVIARGAALWGLDESVVTNHIARYSYGVVMQEKFIDHIHLHEDRLWNKYEDHWMASEQMSWYTKRGANIGKTDPIRHEFYRDLDDVSDLARCKSTVWYSDVPNPTNRKKTSDAKLLCTLKPYFNPSIWNTLEECITPQGVDYRRIHFTIEMVATGGSLLWRLEHEGVEKARTVVEAEYHRE